MTPLIRAHHILPWMILVSVGISGCQHSPKPVPTKTAPTQTIAPTLDLMAVKTPIVSARQAAKQYADTIAAVPVMALASDARHKATVSARATYGATWSGALPKQPPYTTILKQYTAPTGALSLGSTSGGRLIGAATLPLKGKHHVVVARAVGRKTNFGSPTLVKMIKDVAAVVSKKHPGSRLAVGNLSYKNGGDIRWSVSHNSGRDADLAFYVRDRKTGKQMVAPDLIAFDDRGRSKDKRYPNLVFDVQRNWTLARALLLHPKGQIQYLFISTALKSQLIEHATRIKEPKELITRAMGVLKQPTDSLPHNDHFHLRITCTKNDRLMGCVDRGPRWAWVDWHEDDILARVMEMRRGLKTSQKEETQLQILTYLKALRAPRGPDVALEFARASSNEALKKQAMRVALASYNWSGAAIAQTKKVIEDPTSSLNIKGRAYKLLRRSLDTSTIDFVKARVTTATVSNQEKALAINALSHHMSRDLVPFLLDQLGATSPLVRQQAALVLRRITNRSDNVDWSTANVSTRKNQLERWRTWWDNNSGQPRDVWLKAGFAQVGINKSVALTVQGIGPMISQLPKAEDHIVYNINKTMRAVTGRWSSLEQTDGKKLQAYWSKWWRRNRKRLLLQS